MAGKRQHIIPRFLLKGFASQIQGEKVFTHVYRKGGERFETTVENVGVEKHFYGKAGEVSADEEITQIESGYAQLINELRDEPDGSRANNVRVASFVAHLTIRTKQLREFFRESAEYLLDETTKYLSSPLSLKRFVLRKPELIEEELTKSLEGYQVPQELKDYLIALVQENAQEIVDQYLPDIQSSVQALTAQMRSMLPKAVKEGHIKSLARNPAPETRSLSYESLSWFVRETTDPLILGDIGCLFEVAAERRFKPFGDKDDTIVSIYLPISSRKLLVGTMDSVPPHVDAISLNNATVKCSYEYFISAEASANNELLSSSIGEWAGILTAKEMEQLVNEIFEDLDRKPVA